MGNTSEELKDLEARSKESYPVLNKDYYIKRHTFGETAMPGWIRRASRRNYFTRDRILNLLEQEPEYGEMNKVISSWEYYLYPGPRPLSKWGPVCP